MGLQFSSLIFVFVDIPVGTGFLFVKDSASADEVGDMCSSLQVYDFLTKIRYFQINVEQSCNKCR